MLQVNLSLIFSNITYIIYDFILIIIKKIILENFDLEDFMCQYPLHNFGNF